MAQIGSGFMPAGGGFPGIGPTPGSTMLDGPPPSPTPMSFPPAGTGAGGGPGGPFSMSGLAGATTGSVPSTGMPPEVITGITQSAGAVNDILNAWAQVTPDQAPQLSMIRSLIQQYLANLMGAGAGPTSPTAAGPAFPGGGMDRGVAGPGMF